MVIDCSVRMLTESKHRHDAFTNIRYFNFCSQLCRCSCLLNFLLIKRNTSMILL